MIYKELPLVAVQLKMAEGNASFQGYASTFNNVDSYGDTILKGAYLQTLSKNGMPKMFFGHQDHTVPIGKWTKAEEDDTGLLMTGEFTPGLMLAADVRAGMKHGTIDSLSIGYALSKDDYEDTPTGRTIKNVTWLGEVSPVNFPADKFAKLDMASVKSYAEHVKSVQTIREFESFLRDAGGFSKGAAQALTARAKELFNLRDAGLDDLAAKQMDEVAERLRKLAA